MSKPSKSSEDLSTDALFSPLRRTTVALIGAAWGLVVVVPLVAKGRLLDVTENGFLSVIIAALLLTVLGWSLAELTRQVLSRRQTAR